MLRGKTRGSQISTDSRSAIQVGLFAESNSSREAEVRGSETMGIQAHGVSIWLRGVEFDGAIRRRKHRGVRLVIRHEGRTADVLALRGDEGRENLR